MKTRTNRTLRPLTQSDMDFINRQIDAGEARIAALPTKLDKHEYKCDCCNAITLTPICWVEAPCGPRCMGVLHPTGKIVKAGT